MNFFYTFCVLAVFVLIQMKATQSVVSGNNKNNKIDLVRIAKPKIFWFVQVTDIHFSQFSAFSRAPDLKKFCEIHLTVIQPDFVILSGDLTDAKFPDKRRSKQFVEEWKMYRKTLNECREAYDTTWFDIRGNHDAFDVPADFDKRNLFRIYSSQGGKHSSSYSYTHVKPYGNYSIVAIDAVPIPGPRRPFNFVGYMNEERKEKIRDLSEQTKSSNLSVWFGHYTTSLIVDENGNDIRHLMKNAAYYLCGHLHTLAGLITRMYTRHWTGTIELELGDWRDNRLYRVLAIDDDMLSFTDVKYGEWPVVLITNPKNAQFMSSKEPTNKIINSTHIRILAFSTSEILSVEVYIDNRWVGFASHIEGPLYVLKWYPEHYKHGFHSIKVTVQDTVNLIKSVEQQFTLDGGQVSFPFKAQFILMMNISTLGHSVFWAMVVIYNGLLLLLRKFDNIQRIFLKGTNCITRTIAQYINVWLLRVWLVTQVRSLYWWFTGFTLYIAIGPWFIGNVLENEVGVMFIWGLYVKGTFIPGSLTYIYGIFHMVTFNIPLLLIAGYTIHYTREMSNKHHVPRFHKLRHVYIPFLSLVLFNGYIAVLEFPSAYGTKAMILGPVRTGSLFIAFIIYNIAQKQALSIPAVIKDKK